MTPLLTCNEEETPKFPFLTLLISGGHTLILLATSPNKFQTASYNCRRGNRRTIDKVARDIGLKWVALGQELRWRSSVWTNTFPAIADELPEVPAFPSVMPGRLAFSFSGLHSWVDRYIAHNRNPSTGEMTDVRKVALARSFQNIAFRQLEEKLVLALSWCQQNLRKGLSLEHVVVSGGVASNALLRQR